MLNKIQKIVDMVSDPKMLKMLISMNSSGYLKEIGWINSFKHRIPITETEPPCLG